MTLSFPTCAIDHTDQPGGQMEGAFTRLHRETETTRGTLEKFRIIGSLEFSVSIGECHNMIHVFKYLLIINNGLE